MSKLRVKTYIEVLEDGEVIKREMLNESDNLVAMAFNKISNQETDAHVATIGGFSRRSIIQLSETIANVLMQITAEYSDAPLIWELFENTLHNKLGELADQEADKSEKELREALKSKGISDAVIDSIIKNVHEAAKEAWDAENKKK